MCDESDSVGSDGIAAFNQLVPAMHATLAAGPLLIDMVHLSLIAFSDDAEVILPMTKPTEVAELPGVALSGKDARYGPAFELLLNVIERDTTKLKTQGFSLAMRPFIIFMSGSTPTESW